MSSLQKLENTEMQLAVLKVKYRLQNRNRTTFIHVIQLEIMHVSVCVRLLCFTCVGQLAKIGKGVGLEGKSR